MNMTLSVMTNGRIPKPASTSKGGKIQYSCPECASTDIYQGRIYGQSSVICNECGAYGPWRERVKLPIKKAF